LIRYGKVSNYFSKSISHRFLPFYITDEQNHVIAVGTNEVPKHGGQYWEHKYNAETDERPNIMGQPDYEFYSDDNPKKYVSVK